MQISEAGGFVVSNDIETMFKSVDSALHDTAKLAGSIMETNAQSSIPPAKLQGALESAAAGFTKFVEGRRDMIAMQKRLIALKGESNLEVVDYGCFKFVKEAFFEDKSAPATARAA